VCVCVCVCACVYVCVCVCVWGEGGWTFWRIEKLLAAVPIPAPNRQARSSVAIPIMPSRLIKP